jgi:hypothetical protein
MVARRGKEGHEQRVHTSWLSPARQIPLALARNPLASSDIGLILGVPHEWQLRSIDSGRVGENDVSGGGRGSAHPKKQLTSVPEIGNWGGERHPPSGKHRRNGTVAWEVRKIAWILLRKAGVQPSITALSEIVGTRENL